MYTIGQLSEATGVPASTIRFWERKGLLPDAPRTGGQRRYDEHAATEVASLLLCQEAGFTLAEIRRMADELGCRPTTWRTFVKDKLRDIEQRQAQLEHARELLDHALDCRHDTILQCPEYLRLVRSRLPR